MMCLSPYQEKDKKKGKRKPRGSARRPESKDSRVVTSTTGLGKSNKPSATGHKSSNLSFKCVETES